MAAPARQIPLENPVDPFGYDPAVHDMVRPLLRFLFERYWRVEVEGIEHVPVRGPALIIANHSGAVPFDAAMIGAAVELRGRRPRLVRFLFDRFVSEMPLVGSAYAKLGAVPASYDNAVSLLRQGELVGVFPEGVAGVAKGFSRRYRLQSFRSGFVRMSVNERVPVIPVAVVGAEETYPVIAKWQRLGPLRGLLGVPYVPLTPLFPLLGPFGAIPLPSRWRMRFGAPLDFHRDLSKLELSTRTAGLLAQAVRRQIQGMLHEELAQRNTVF